MNNNWFIFFSAGMVAGGLVGYYICKKKYHIVKLEEAEEPVKYSGKGKLKDEINKEYKEKIYEASYKKEEKEGDEEWEEANKVNPVEPEMVPYVISPDCYVGEHDDYAKIVLHYYEDNEVLEYEEYNLDKGEDHFADIGSTIGYDAINHFGEFEKDTVFVRNEALGNDYEVLLEHCAYDEGGED